VIRIQDFGKGEYFVNAIDSCCWVAIPSVTFAAFRLITQAHLIRVKKNIQKALNE
jgi:hypothetical protein